MNTLYPEMEPYQKGFLQVSPLHKIYFEECGNPNGQPILFLHGGPGGGIHSNHRRFYDPKYYRIILFDQRGCGQSTPFAELQENTTWHLVSDIEKLRLHLGISRWIVFGGSWGTTLALAYGITHPDSCLGFILRGIFLCRPWEIEWFYQKGASLVFPDLWEKYENQIPQLQRHDMVKAYYEQLTSEDEKLRLRAAQVWSMWEASTSKLIIDEHFIQEYEEPEKALPFARIECHYFINNAFFPSENYLLENIHKINHLPCSIIHGRYDMVCPAKNAWELHKAWPKSKLSFAADSGHSVFEPTILKYVLEAIDSFKKLKI